MNTLYLLRHTNAAPGGLSLSDKDRPLNDQGLDACLSIAAKLQDDRIQPDLIICSTAIRTRQTLEGIRSIWDPCPEIIYEDSIYEAYTNDIRSAISHYTADYKDILVIGHNPGLQDLTLQLSNNPGTPSHKEALMDFSPGCMAKLTCDDYSWSGVSLTKFTFLKFYRP